MQANLKDFIVQTLVDIAEGVDEASKKTKKLVTFTGDLARGGSGPRQDVQFDLAVTVTDGKDKAGAGSAGLNIKILSAKIGTETGESSKVEAVSRIGFSVPMYISLV